MIEYKVNKVLIFCKLLPSSCFGLNDNGNLMTLLIILYLLILLHQLFNNNCITHSSILYIDECVHRYFNAKRDGKLVKTGWYNACCRK